MNYCKNCGKELKLTAEVNGICLECEQKVREHIDSMLPDETCKWQSADNPPKGDVGYWTDEVVVISNYGDVFSLAYYHGEKTGSWQRPARFNKGENVDRWINKPQS